MQYGRQVEECSAGTDYNSTTGREKIGVGEMSFGCGMGGSFVQDGQELSQNVFFFLGGANGSARAIQWEASQVIPRGQRGKGEKG